MERRSSIGSSGASSTSGRGDPSVYGDRAGELRAKYGINRSRFLVSAGEHLRMFVLNTSGPLFRKNPKLRQAVNFAVDRKALLRERGPLAGTLTDQYLPPGVPGYRNERIYPLTGPDVKKATRARRRATRGAAKRCCTPSRNPVGRRSGPDPQGQPRQRSASRSRSRRFPAPVLFGKLATPGEPFDIGWHRLVRHRRPDSFGSTGIFDGRTIGEPGTPGTTRISTRRRTTGSSTQASRLPTGTGALPALRELDVDYREERGARRSRSPTTGRSRSSSARTGCVVVNPYPRPRRGLPEVATPRSAPGPSPRRRLRRTRCPSGDCRRG